MGPAEASPQKTEQDAIPSYLNQSLNLAAK